jgi:predicted ATPase/Tfp pilus assembly protein PilF/DNA-binding XRE family transcriptional regulator
MSADARSIMDSDSPPTFAALLRRYRVAAGLTQEELAERANLSVRGVSDLERGLRTVPRRETVHLLATALALSPDRRAELDAAIDRRRGPAMQGTILSLPAEPNPLIGREQEEARAIHLLRWEGVRLLTLTGPGGVGKTRLALRVARSLAEDFADAVTFVPLAPIGEPALVPASLAQALGVREQSGRSFEESLVTTLRARQRLLVLDNFEHLLAVAPFVSRLLASCPQLTVLVTSRAPLHLQQEQEMEVRPLTARASAPDAVRSPAVTLFVQRARAVRPDYRLSHADAPIVAEICARLDGLPLAIELAAARIKLFPPTALLQHLTQPLAVLTAGAADQPSRHQTLRNTIAWSYSLLSVEEQALFARLSVFAGGWTFEAAEVVCGAGGQTDLLQELSSLVDQSLVWRESEEARFAMLETIRQYAAEQLEARGEDEAIGAAHALYFLRLAEEAEAPLRGPQAGEWHPLLERELGNVRAALTWFLEHGHIEEVLRLSSGLYEFWRARAHWSEGQHWLEAGLAGSEGVEPRTRARALSMAGVLLTSRGEYERGTAMLEEALSLARQAGDSQRAAVVLRYLGLVMHRQGATNQAVQQIEEGLELFRAAGDARGVAVSLNSLGIIAAEQGDFSLAEAHHREAVALYREQEDIGRVALSLNYLGSSLLEQGRYAEARVGLEEGLATIRRLAFKADLPYLLHNLGRVACAQGEMERAEALFAEALSLNREAGDTWINVAVLGQMVELAMKQGKVTRAARLAGAEQAAREATNIPNPPADWERQEWAVSRAREFLGMEAFTRAWEEGRAMGLDDAIEYALDQQSVD